MDGEHGAQAADPVGRRREWSSLGGEAVLSCTGLSTVLPSMKLDSKHPRATAPSTQGTYRAARAVHWILNKLQQSQMSGSKNAEVCIPRSRGGEKNQRLLQQESRYAVYAGHSKEQGREASAGQECCERVWSGRVPYAVTDRRSGQLPGRAESFPRVRPCARTGRRALGAIVAGGFWRGSAHQDEGGS